MQIKDAFTKSSNLSGILEGTNQTFSISHIHHSAKVIVDEEGSEAAAATEALISPLIGVDSIIADKPFIFFIKDSLSNAILFAGRVSDPEQAPEQLLDNSEAPIAQELSSAPNEVPIQKMQRPGPPPPLPPRKQSRPNGFPSSSLINFEDGEDLLQPKPPRSVTTTTAKTSRPITTTTPPPFVRVRPMKETGHEHQPKPTTPPDEDSAEADSTETSPPPFIRKPHTEAAPTKPSTSTEETELTDSAEDEDDEPMFTFWRKISFPGYRVLWYRYYGLDQSKLKRRPERFTFSS